MKQCQGQVSAQRTCVCYEPLSQLQHLVPLRMSHVHNVLSPSALPGSCTLTPVASFMESVHLTRGLPRFLLPSVFPSIIVFSKKTKTTKKQKTTTTKKNTLPSHDDTFKVGQLQCCHFCLWRCFISGLICSRTHAAARGIRRGLLQHRTSDKLVLSPTSLLHCLAFASVHSNYIHRV